MVARSQSSAAGVLALLYEPDPVFKQHALKALSPLVPRFWAEISEHISLMLAFIIFSNSLIHSFTENLSTRQSSFQKRPVMSLHCSPAKYITSSESMTNLSLSRWAPETRSRPKLVLMAQKNTLRLSSVRLSSSIQTHIQTCQTAKAIDRYIQLRCKDLSASKKDIVDPRLQTIIENIFSRCIEEAEYKQVRWTWYLCCPDELIFILRQSALL